MTAVKTEDDPNYIVSIKYTGVIQDLCWGGLLTKIEGILERVRGMLTSLQKPFFDAS